MAQAGFEVGLWTRFLALAAGFLVLTFGSIWALDSSGRNLAATTPGRERALAVAAYGQVAGSEAVLVIGSSRVRDGFAAAFAQRLLTERFGRRLGLPACHKLGLASLRPTLILDLLRQVTRVHPPRELLVLAVEERYFTRRGVGGLDEESDDDGPQTAGLASGIWRGLAGLVELPMGWMPDTRAAVERMLGRMGDRNTPDRWAFPDNFGGASRTEEEVLGALPRDTRWTWSSEQDPEQIAWSKVLDLLPKLPCEVLLVRMPVSRSYLQRQGGQLEARFQSRIVADIQRRGLAYADLAEVSNPMPQRMFKNNSHLTYPGALEVTRRLIEGEIMQRLAAARAR